ncbi:MAG: TatD family hydrolase [Chloroflexi bacterium]|nr:TatD family hydrolase [Chloroflexota bacterium]
MFRLIDTHAHLEEVADLPGALDRARQAGVIAVVGVGSDIPSNRAILKLAAEHPGFVYPALGLHPWRLGGVDIEASLEFIRANIDQAVGVGEVGLDYSKPVRDTADKALQQRVFSETLRIAREHDKPALIHSRYAWADAFNLAEKAGVRKAVFHWYTGTSSVLRAILAAGYYISANPAVGYHDEHRRAVRATGLDQLLFETDSPVVYQPGTPSELKAAPADAGLVLKLVAELKGLSEARVAEAATANAARLFSLIASG